MDLLNKKRIAKYDRVMSRLYNRSRSDVNQKTYVTRHEIPSSVSLGAKPSSSNVNSSVVSELPVVLNDYSPEVPVKKTFVVKPRRTVKSLDPATSPHRVVSNVNARPKRPSEPKVCNIRAGGSTPALSNRGKDRWSNTHVRQCYSSRSHSKLKELKDEIKEFRECDKQMKLRSRLFQTCGVVLDDVGQVAVDKAVQVAVPDGENQRAQIWIEACRRPELLRKSIVELRNTHLCGRHFGECMYAKGRLKRDAVPTLNLGPNTLISIGTQTDPIKGKRSNNMPSLKRHTVNKINPNVKNLLKSIYKQKHKKPKGYSNRLKMFALSVYFANPKVYKFVAKALDLPPVSSLAGTRIPIGTKMTEYLKDMLSQIAQCFSPTDKETVLCVGKLPLKPTVFYHLKRDKIVGLEEVDDVQSLHVAKNAITLMLKSTSGAWHLPIGYSFISSNESGEQLQNWIIVTLKQLLDIGFKVRAVVSDLGSEFIQFTKSMGVSREKPYFIIDDNKIFYIFDVPTLLKSTRDNLMEYYFEFDDKTATWDDVHMLYELDKTKLHIAPKLSSAHIFPNKFQKQRLSLAAQVFSNSVKVAFMVYKNHGLLGPCDGTTEFVEIMNNVFDLLNSNTLYISEVKNRPYRGKDYQKIWLVKAIAMLSKLVVRSRFTDGDVTASVTFIDGFIITINSIVQLQEQLAEDFFDDDFTLLTRHLNNECLENYLNTLRKVTGVRKSFTCSLFEKVFRKSFLYQALNLLRREKKSTEDFEIVLKRYSEFIEETPRVSKATSEENEMNRIVKLALKDFTLPELDGSYQQHMNRSMSICNYLLGQCNNYHICHENILKSGIDEKPPVAYMLLHTQEMEQYFLQHFESLLGNNITSKFYAGFKKIQLFIRHCPCPCFPIAFFQKMFIRMRIRHVVKTTNDLLKRNKSSGDPTSITIEQL